MGAEPLRGLEDVDAALYAKRAVVRMLGMRRTVFVVPAPLAGVVQAACTDDVASRMRRQLEKDLAKGGVGNGDAAGWLRDVEAGVLRALAARGGGATGAQLSADEPRLRTQLVYRGRSKACNEAGPPISRRGYARADRGRGRAHGPGAPAGRLVVRAVRRWFLPDAWLQPVRRRCLPSSRW